MLNQVEIGKSRHKRNSSPKKESAPVEDRGAEERRGRRRPEQNVGPTRQKVFKRYSVTSTVRAAGTSGRAFGTLAAFGVPKKNFMKCTKT